MGLLPEMISAPAGRIGAAAQNALEVARFGGLQTGEEPSPYDVLADRQIFRLRRYYPSSGPRADVPAVLLIPPMMLAAEIYDVSPASSAVTILHEHGVEPWVIDFGAPEKEEGGLERSLTDHVLAVSEAITLIAEEAGRDVHIGGYSQGGMFCYQAAAYRRSESIASVIVFGSPVDTRGTLTFGMPEELLTRGAAFLADNVLARTALPAWASRTGFRLMDPAKSLRQRLQFIRQLHDREALLPRERQRQFLETDGWVAWPGPALAEVVKQFGVHNRMVSGGFVIENRLVTLADMQCPVLAFVGETDDIAPARTVRAVRRAAPRSEIYEVALQAGHFGLVVGSTSVETTWPTVARWARSQDSTGRPPQGIEPAREVEPTEAEQPGLGDRIGTGVELAAGAGFGAARALAGAATAASRTMFDLIGDGSGEFGRLNRLGRIGPGTRISFGLLVDEQAKSSPEEVALLFEDRGHTRAAVNERIDNVVRGLLEIGIRQGEHVGVLMQTRPSALTAVVSLNRLGAVAVLMRPDGDHAHEAELGKVGRIICDPQNGERVASETGRKIFVLGGGGGPRELAAGLIDMERIDPDAVVSPAWYRPNPGRAGDLAFILFTGSGERTRANRISNGRWALSAFGTASSAALDARDTVYSATPVYHPSALLMTIGGAIAGGSRLAVAEDLGPENFWDEIRRYGATIVSYTWTMMDEIVEAPPHPGERHHPVRLFIGSGMPRSTWKRVGERFAPARVLEFYASTEGDAVLVNLTGEKAGCKGVPLPGSAEVRIAGYDPEAGRLIEQEDGFVSESGSREAGMLLARVQLAAAAASGAGTLRGVFEAGDAWLQTGDLFRRDVEGDYWLVDHAGAVVQTAGGVVPAGPIQDALSDLDCVRLAQAYGVERVDGTSEIPVAAVTLREGSRVTAGDLDRVLGLLGDEGRPDLVHVIEEMPITTWSRIRTDALAEAGLPPASRPARAWYWNEHERGYRALTKAARARLAGDG